MMWNERIERERERAALDPVQYGVLQIEMTCGESCRDYAHEVCKTSHLITTWVTVLNQCSMRLT